MRDDDFWENPKLIKSIQSLIFHSGGGCVRCVQPWVWLLLFVCFSEWKKGKRWSGAWGILAWCMWVKGKLGAHSPGKRVHLSFGVTCVYAFTPLHFVPWPLSAFLLSGARSSLGVAFGEWRGTSACSMRVQFYQTPGTTQTQHEEKKVKHR
jgi:hypothetical protein